MQLPTNIHGFVNVSKYPLLWLEFFPVPASMASVAEAIELRAHQVLRPRQWWGFADWLAWGYHRQTVVMVMFAGATWNLFEAFGSEAIQLETKYWKQAFK